MMFKKFRKVSIGILSAVFVSCCFAFTACTDSCSDKNADNYDGLFSGDTHSYVLTADYTLTDADVKGTQGADNVTLGYICTFNLGGHTLNLGGYTLNITSSSADVVKFENGKIKNGALNISVPNGDIEFTGTDIDRTVTYELEAASETIRFSNAVISGKCTVKSNTNVNVEYSNVGDITLSGNGTLNAGSGAALGAVTVSENASGAKVNITSEASVSNMELHAAANVSVAGSVSQVKVAESAKNDSASLSIDIKQTASVDKVELNAAASVSVAGTVQAVTVAEAAKSDSAQLSISVADTAEVARVELSAPAAVEVSGGVSNIVVKDTAGGSSVTLTESANVATVAVNASDITIDSDENATVSKVVVAESVADKVTSNIEITTATAEEMNEYLAHQHIFVIVSRDEATCTEAGKLHYACDCGDTNEKIIPAKGHQYVYTLLKEPTADEKGQGLYRCIRCGHEYTVEVEYSVSVVINGLENLFSLIPDGTYTISADKATPITATQNGFAVVVNEFEAVVEVEGGKLTGTCKGSVTISDEEDETMTFKAVVDGTQVYVSYSFGNEDNTFEGSEYIALSALVKMGLSQFLPVDVEELGDLLPYLENINGGEINLPFELLEKLADGLFTKTTQDGNTVYSFDAEKLLATLTSFGNKTLDTIIDGVLGEGAFDAIAGLADGLADKTVYRIALEVFDFAEQFGISQDELFLLAQTIFEQIMPDSEIDIEELVKSYYNKSVAAVVAEITNTTEAQAKQLIEQKVAEYVGLCRETTVADVVNMLLNLDIPEFGPSGGTNAPDYNEPDYNESVMLSEATEGGGALTFEALLEVLNNYAGNVTFNITLTPDNKLVSFEISYLDENGIKVSIIKNADSLIPVISVDVMGVKVDVDKTENGAQASVEVMGMTFSLTADKTDTGAELNFAMDMGEATADVTLSITAKKDAQNNICGAEFEISGDVVIGTEDTLELSGKGSAEKNGSAQPDSSVWASFDGDKAIYYHMDVTMAEDDYSKSSVRLKYVNDASGEYYLLTQTRYEYDFDPDCDIPLIYEVVYSARLLCIDGLPEIMLMYEKDCKNWIRLYITHYALAEVSRAKLTVNGAGEIIKGETEVVGERAVNFSGGCFYNIKTGETASESQHSYEYSGKYAEGSSQCSDGIIVTKTCSGCNRTETIRRDYHFYIENNIVLKTQCGEDSYVRERECIVCHNKELSYYLYEHETSIANKYIVTEEKYNELLQDTDIETLKGRYVKVTDLAEYGFETEGFYYGNLRLEHCAYCGLNKYLYTYYTNTQADGCIRHEAILIEYKGNAGFEGFEYKFETTREGHYAPEGSSELYGDISVAVNEAKAIIGGELPFVPERASYTEYRCLGCDSLEEKHIHFENDSVKGVLDLHASYSGDSLVNWSYDCWIGNLDIVVREAARYGQSLEGAMYGDVQYYMSQNYSRIYIHLGVEDNNTMQISVEIDGNRGTMSVAEYIYLQCTEVRREYELSAGGEWVLENTESSARHNMSSGYVYADNCREDGYYYTNACLVCGYTNGGYDVKYEHNHVYSGTYESDIHNYSSYLTDNSLSGLEATISFNSVCEDCNTLIDVTIVLRRSWTLENDVYIKAEGITIDLNGFTIDLNGYHLVIYSYAGEQLTVTDNTFDTSSIEGYDPETYEGEYNSRITNSNEYGVFVIVSREILVGTIAIECDVFASDVDDRYSLFESFKNDKGYELSLLMAERPVIPQM